MRPRRGDYGFDAPYVLLGLATAAALGLGAAIILLVNSFPTLASLSLAASVVFALSTLSFLWTTRRGKFMVWDELLASLAAARR